MISVTLTTPERTEQLAGMLAGMLEPGDVVALDGPIGAGKTTFVRHAARALGTHEPVRSPTYTIAHEYELGGGRSIGHLDLYRSGPMGEAAWGDVEPYLDATYAFIEWPAAGERWISDRVTWTVSLRHLGGDSRLVRIEGRDEGRMRRLADAAAGLVR